MPARTYKNMLTVATPPFRPGKYISLTITVIPTKVQENQHQNTWSETGNDVDGGTALNDEDANDNNDTPGQRQVTTSTEVRH